MVEAVANSLRYLMREDITALAAYLRRERQDDKTGTQLILRLRIWLHSRLGSLQHRVLKNTEPKDLRRRPQRSRRWREGVLHRDPQRRLRAASSQRPHMELLAMDERRVAGLGA
jgi:hypothetical protein